MKWLYKANSSAALTQPGPVPSHNESTASSGSKSSGAPQLRAEDPVDNTEKWAVPSEIEDEAKPQSIPEVVGRTPSGRRQSRTVASPIPAMLAESMGLAEEQVSSASPATVEHFKKVASNRR